MTMRLNSTNAIKRSCRGLSTEESGTSTLNAKKITKLSFLQAFGLLGPPLLLAVLVSAVWTAASMLFEPSLVLVMLPRTL